MAPNSQKDHNKLGKVGKEAFDLLSELMPRRKKVPNGYNHGGNTEQCIDANQAAVRYGGYLLTATGSQIKTVMEQPKPVKANVHPAFQYQYQNYGYRKTGY